MHFTPDGTSAGHGLGRRGPGRRGGDLGRRRPARSSAGSRATATSSTTPSSRPTARRLATCSYDKMIELWDAGTGAVLRTLEGHTGAVYDVAFSPDGRFLVSARADDTCKVWRVEDGLRMDTLPQPLKAEYACTFSPDGRTIVAGGRRQQHPGLAVRLARQAGDQPDGAGAVRPRGGDRPAGVHARRLAAGLDRRGPHDQGLGRRRLHRAAALGRSAGRRVGTGVPRRRRAGRRSPGRLVGPVHDARGQHGRILDRPRASGRRGNARRGADARGRRTRAERRARAGQPAGAPRPSDGRHRRGRPCRCGLLPVRRQGRRGVGLRGGRVAFGFEARLVPRGARRPRRPRAAGAAAGGARLVLHVPRQGRHRDRRLPRLQLGGDEHRRVSLCQRRGGPALALSPRAGLGLPGLSGRGQAVGLLRHDAAGARAGRAVLRRPAASARDEARAQRIAGLHALLRERRRRPPRAGEGLAAVLHRPRRRRVPGQDPRRPGSPGARIPIHDDGPRPPPRFQGDARQGQSDGRMPAVPGNSR